MSQRPDELNRAKTSAALPPTRDTMFMSVEMVDLNPSTRNYSSPMFLRRRLSNTSTGS